MRTEPIEYLSSGEAAEMLAITVAAYRMRWKRGRLPFAPAARTGGNLLWPRHDVERYAALERVVA